MAYSDQVLRIYFSLAEDLMIVLKETIQVQQPLKSVFNYTSDFSHIKDWDPEVIASSAKKPGKIGVGAVFNLTLKFGLFRPKMIYEIKEYVPYSKVVLTGRADSFTALDTIHFTRTSAGTKIDYRADIRFSGWMKQFERLLAPDLIKSGREAINGLQHVLEDHSGCLHQKGLFSLSPTIFDRLADHLILPGMLMFSRLGYQFSSRFWDKDGETLYGKKVVITGGTSGIGMAAAFKLAEKKAFLTIIARNREKAIQVKQKIVEKTGNPHVDYLIADLSLMNDINRVAAQIKDTQKTIDILINNAGALFNERNDTAEGLEQTFALDLLGVFYLTHLLQNSFSAQGGRIINVSSGGMYTQPIDVNDLQNRHLPYNGAKAYARAKRGIVILTEIWAEQMHRSKVVVHAMHPGWVDTPGIEQALPGFHTLVHGILRTPAQGADTIVWLAASKKAMMCTGNFWLDRRPHDTVVFPNTGTSAEEKQILWEKLTRMIDRY